MYITEEVCSALREPEPTPEQRRERFLESRTDEHSVVSKIGYLIGVPEETFRTEQSSMDTEVYDQLTKKDFARIVRNLCVLRTQCERNFTRFSRAITFDLKNLHTLPQTKDAVLQLHKDGVEVVKSNPKMEDYIVRLNTLIRSKIDACKPLFPIWVEWDYIKALFVVPGGESVAKNKALFDDYMANISLYPYQQFLVWKFGPSDGNILYNDEKFLCQLYQQHGAYFTEIQNVRGAGLQTKRDIISFLDAAEKAVMLVDCENCDPIKLCAALDSMQQTTLEKISKIILFNDVNASSAWTLLEKHTAAPIVHQMTKRVKVHKSLVDVELVAGACKEHYQNHVDSFVLCSSDSDFWGLIESMADAKFLVMLEESKTSDDMVELMLNEDIPFCYLDRFCQSGTSAEMKTDALLSECRLFLSRQFQPFNVETMLNMAFAQTRIEMSKRERQQFYDRYIKTMQLVVDPDGSVTIKMKEPTK